MKNGAAMFVKQILCVLRSVAKAKSMAIKSKTDAIRARLIVFSLLKNKKLSLGAFSDKIHALLGQQPGHRHDTSTAADDQGNAIVLYKATTATHDPAPLPLADDDHNEKTNMELDTCYAYHYHDDDDKYPDLRHSLFDDVEDDELDLGGPNASVIDLVRNSKEQWENFSLEDEIDHVADLFIMKFHKNMRMQKLESFKRYQEMLQRSA